MREYLAKYRKYVDGFEICMDYYSGFEGIIEHRHAVGLPAYARKRVVKKVPSLVEGYTEIGLNDK